MKRSIPAIAVVLLLIGAFCIGSERTAPEPANDLPLTSMGTLKLFPYQDTDELMFSAERPASVLLDGKFVGTYSDFRHNTPAHFRLPSGEHLVQVDLVGCVGCEPFWRK